MKIFCEGATPHPLCTYGASTPSMLKSWVRHWVTCLPYVRTLEVNHCYYDVTPRMTSVKGHTRPCVTFFDTFEDNILLVWTTEQKTLTAG